MTTIPDDSVFSQRDILTIEKAAAFLQVPAQSLYVYARRGVVPSFRIGKHVRFRAEDLRDWIDRQVRTWMGRA